MSTLLLRLAAPLQAWGMDGRFERRGTERMPTKSGVIGLLAAAMGMRRDENLDKMNMLRFGVRVDHEGKLLRDYHTAHNQKSAYVTNRYYLSDAVFLAGIEGADNLLEELDEALDHPAFPLFLGRRSCPPEGQINLHVRKGISLIEALINEPSLVRQGFTANRTPHSPPMIYCDADASNRPMFLQQDLPLSWNPIHRKYGFRQICAISIPTNPHTLGTIPATDHDPMSDLEV